MDWSVEVEYLCLCVIQWALWNRLACEGVVQQLLLKQSWHRGHKSQSFTLFRMITPPLKDAINLQAGIQAHFTASSEQTTTGSEAAACSVDLSIMHHLRKWKTKQILYAISSSSIKRGNVAWSAQLLLLQIFYQSPWLLSHFPVCLAQFHCSWCFFKEKKKKVREETDTEKWIGKHLKQNQKKGHAPH